MGVAGFDPAPLFVALYFLAKNPGPAARRVVVWFCAFCLVGVALWGVTLTRLFGDALTRIPWARFVHALLHAGPWTVVGKLVIACGLLGWGVYAMRKKLAARGVEAPQKERKNRSARGLFLFAVGFIVVITADMTFAAYVAIASPEPLWAQFLGFQIWSLVAQFPLTIFFVMLLLGREQMFTQALDRLRARWGSKLVLTLPVVAIALGLTLLMDVLLYPLANLTLLPFLH